jgi:predicted nicotinamide N-methyase
MEEEEPDNGIHLQGTSDNAVVVFNQSRIDGLREGSRHFTMANRELEIHQGYKADTKGGTAIGFGASVYNGAVVLSSYIESFPDTVINKNCIELGCGPGLVGIVACALGASKTVVTDGDMISVDLAAENIIQNCTTKEVHRGKIMARKLYWGDDNDIQACKAAFTTTGVEVEEDTNNIDVVLAADVVALPYAAAYDALYGTFTRLCSSSTVIYLCYQRRHHSESAFFDKLRQSFTVTEVPLEHLHADFQGPSVNPVKIFKITPIFAVVGG